MPKPALFFDRDNTLIISDGYLGDPDGVVLVRGAADAIARARALGFAVVTISNQSGVARGMFSEEAVQAVNARMDQLLLQANPQAKIDRHEYCPYHPEALLEQYRQDSNLRKPKPGMILRAAGALDLDLASSWVVGDAPRDVAAGRAAGCHTILLSDPALPPSPATLEDGGVDPDETVSSLSQAMDVIEAVASATAADDSQQAVEDIETARRQLAPEVGPRKTPAPQTTKPSPPPAAQGGKAIMEHQQVAPPAPQPPVAPAESPAPLDRPALPEARPQAPFSVAKLIAGITQALALAAAVTAVVAIYFNRADIPFTPLLLAIFLETLTIALLLMGRDR